MYNEHDGALFITILHHHSMPPNSTAACLFFLPGRMPYAIFGTTTGLFIAVYHEVVAISCPLGSGCGSDSGSERKQAISYHLW